MNDPSVFQKLIPDKFLMSFWEQNIQSDGRSFSQHREISLRRIKESQIIINHDGNVLQSSFKFTKAEKKISYKNLLKNDPIQTQLDRLDIEFEEQNNCQYIAIENLKQTFINRFKNFSKILPKDKILKIDIKILFDNNNILLALLYSILIQLYQFLNSQNQLNIEDLFIPILVKGFSSKENQQKIWLIDPNQNEFEQQKYFPEFLMVLVIDKNIKQSVLYSAGSGIVLSDYQNLQKLLEEIQFENKLQNIFQFVLSKEYDVAKIIQIIFLTIIMKVKLFFIFLLFSIEYMTNPLDTGFDRINKRQVSLKLRIERLNSLVDSIKASMQDKIDLVEGFLDVTIKKQRQLVKLQKSKLISERISQEMKKEHFEELESIIDNLNKEKQDTEGLEQLFSLNSKQKNLYLKLVNLYPYIFQKLQSINSLFLFSIFYQQTQ